jgi:hypothetical protein
MPEYAENLSCIVMQTSFAYAQLRRNLSSERVVIKVTKLQQVAIDDKSRRQAPSRSSQVEQE